jgi:hypothetical protein
MSFGLIGRPHTFQQVMNATLSPLLRKSVLVFFGDILAYNTTYEEHLRHLEQVFQILDREQWRVKLSKCTFARREIPYLSYVIRSNGVTTCPKKIQTVNDWPQPQNVKDLRSFLGLFDDYRKFVKHYAIIAKPLT